LYSCSASESQKFFQQAGAEPDIFILGGPLEGAVLQQEELSIVSVELSERDLQKET